MGEQDSLAPHLVALAKSSRAQAWAWRGALLFVAVVAKPSFDWVVSRYDRPSAEALTMRAATLERLVGLPIAATDERTLRDRVAQLEKRVEGWDAAEHAHDVELYERFVSLAAASTERRPALRAAAARAAVDQFRLAVGRGLSPSAAAGAALETPVPR